MQYVLESKVILMALKREREKTKVNKEEEKSMHHGQDNDECK